MTPSQWEALTAVVRGERPDRPLCGFIADSPWLPEWTGKASILDYYTSETVWLESHLQAVRTFPDALFLPGFWSEFGMCTEPSAFGSRLLWHEHELPFAEPLVRGSETALNLTVPDVRSAGLLPFTLRRLVRMRPAIEAEGHLLRFAVARGPLNIASFLMGTTEFLTAMLLDPDGTHAMLEVITGFLEAWIQAQAAAIPTIRGVMILDDLVGFLGPGEVDRYAMPYLQRVFAAIDSDVRLFHNDANGTLCAPHLAKAGINLFNFSFEHPLAGMLDLAGPEVTLLGNLAPRDVLANGTPEQVRQGVAAMKTAWRRPGARVILSCGGGLPPGVPTVNLRAFLDESASGA